MIERAPFDKNNSKRLIREVALTFTIQLILVVALVQVDRLVGLGGNLHVLVGIVFILLTIIVLDRTGKPYERYGFSLGKPHIDVLWMLGAIVLLFPPIAFFSPYVWGMGNTHFRFVIPEGYPAAIVMHFVVVAIPEEVFYRGYLLGRLDDIFPKRKRVLGAEVGIGLLIQAVLFALGHYLVDFHPGRLAVFFPALAFGWLKAKRKTLGAPILFHGASNVFMEVFRAGLGL
jgi:membrane protease YdiL (CAAX protease family)